jgi:hypothetical protein
MGSTEKTLLKCRGLNRYGNPALRPEGTAETASNVVCDAPDTYSPRRGFDRLDGTLPGSATVRDLIAYKDEILVYGSNGKLYLYNDSGATPSFDVFKIDDSTDYTDTSTYVLPTEANSNLYLTSALGVVKLETTTGYVGEAGMPAGLTGEASAPSDAGEADGFLADGSSVAYRVVFGITDANGNLIIGAPSNPILVTNSHGHATDVKLKFDIPAEITVNHFYRVYRTNTATSVDAVGDVMRLVYEAQPSAPDIVNRYVIYTDSSSDAMIADALELYTNTNQGGINLSNRQPPKCKDMTFFQNSMFFANLTYRHTYSFQLLATGGANGVVNGTTVAIAGRTYTAAAAENIGNEEFYVSTASGSPAVDVRLTAESLVRVINRNTAHNSSVYAYYDSGLNDLPGKIRIEERNYGGSAFHVQCAAKGAAFSPVLTSERTSTAETAPNRVAWSKAQQPEHCPIIHYTDVGSKQTNIWRIVALRENLFILTDRGIYLLTGQDENSFSVIPFDLTLSILAPLSAVALNNTIFCLTDQGVCRVDEKGVALISMPFEDDVKSWMGESLTNLKTLTRGCKYETDRKYILAVPQLSSDTYATAFWVYNSTNDVWTTWDRTASALLVNPANDRLYLAPGGASQLSRERKGYNFFDFCDEPIDVTVTSVTTNVLTLSNTVGISVGDVYAESTTAFSAISAIDTFANTITLDADLSWNTGAYEVWPAYTSTITWNPITDGGAAHIKQFSEAAVLTSFSFHNGQVGFKTDQEQDWSYITLPGTSSSDLWGLFAWGEVPWGGEAGMLRAHRTYIPRTKQRSSGLYVQFTIETALTEWEIVGVEITARSSSQRSGR